MVNLESDPASAPPAAPGGATGADRVARGGPTVIALCALVALGLVVPAAVLTGAAQPSVAGLADPGAVVRWGLPLVRAIQDVGAAATIGLLLMAGLIVPEGARTARRATAARYAAATGAVWAVAAVVGTVLGFADIAGEPLSTPGFVAQMWSSVWSIDALRVTAISALLAIVVAIGAALARTRGAMAWLFFVGLFAVLPLALGGHAAGSADHDAAVNSLAFHLLGVVVWVGGLLALVALRPVLGKATAASVARYSTLAGWCFVFVALSGVLNAWIRIGDLGGLWTAYGVLIIGKVVALVLLGLAGWWQRRGIVDRLREGVAVRHAFTRLATLEAVVMGAAIGIATVLARSAPPVPDTLPGKADPVLALSGYATPAPITAASWLTSWRIEWLFATVAVLAVGLYLAGAVRMHRRGDRWPVGRTICWIVGWAIFAYTTNGAPGIYGRVMFSVHMTMHMTISMAVPMLLVLAAPVTLALRTLEPRRDKTLGPRELILAVVHSRVMRVLGNPIVAGLIFFGSLVVFYFSPLLQLAMETHTGHILMVFHFLAAGYLFAWVLVGVDPGPKKWQPSLRLVVLFATISFHAFFGVALMMGTSVLAPDFFDQLHLSWVPDPLADQRLGGAVAWGVGELPTLVLALLVTLAWVRADDAESRRGDRQADRDDDAQLRAYNAQLAAMAAADHRTRPHGTKE